MQNFASELIWVAHAVEMSTLFVYTRTSHGQNEFNPIPPWVDYYPV